MPDFRRFFVPGGTYSGLGMIRKGTLMGLAALDPNLPDWPPINYGS
jgi:hypothetical protein